MVKILQIHFCLYKMIVQMYLRVKLKITWQVDKPAAGVIYCAAVSIVVIT